LVKMYVPVSQSRRSRSISCVRLAISLMHRNHK
jgi:hypothetical protein